MLISVPNSTYYGEIRELSSPFWVPCTTLQDLIALANQKVSCFIQIAPTTNIQGSSLPPWINSGNCSGETQITVYYRGDADYLFKVNAGTYKNKVEHISLNGDLKKPTRDSNYMWRGFTEDVIVSMVENLVIGHGWALRKDYKKHGKVDFNSLDTPTKKLIKSAISIQFCETTRLWKALGFGKGFGHLKEVERLAGKKKIKAIKLYRQITGLTLKASKQRVEHYITFGSWQPHDQELETLFTMSTKGLTEMVYAFPDRFNFNSP